MKSKKDTRFWLTTIYEKLEQTKQSYKSFQREIENNGCFIVKLDSDTVKIYTPELAVIFTSKELPARNMDTQKETTINGWEYLKTYIEAYKEGEQYFETEFKVSPDTLYGVNKEQYVRDIHLNFFHVQHTKIINEGWGCVKKKSLYILTHRAIREYGYYSGIVDKVEEQLKKYPKPFAMFDKCEYNLPPQQSTKEDLSENTEPNNLTISTIEDWLFEFKERNILTEPHYTNLVDALTYYFENGTFPKLKQTIKVGRVNKKLLGWHLNRIFHSEGKGVEIDLLSFAKASISTFKDVEFDEKDIQNSNLYKYFTTKTK